MLGSIVLLHYKLELPRESIFNLFELFILISFAKNNSYISCWLFLESSLFESDVPKMAQMITAIRIKRTITATNI